MARFTKSYSEPYSLTAKTLYQFSQSFLFIMLAESNFNDKFLTVLQGVNY